MLGAGQGVGKAKMGVGGTDYCYCDKCKIRVKHTRGAPCTEQICPKCGKGVFLAEHNDRLTCGNCGYMEIKK